jgi:hypothetical protein
MGLIQRKEKDMTGGISDLKRVDQSAVIGA